MLAGPFRLDGQKLIELAAGAIESILLLFRDSRPDERTAFVVDESQHDRRCELASQVGLVVTAPDDFATEHPQVIAMATQRRGGEVLPEQIQQKGFEALDDAPSQRDIGCFAAPALWPVLQVRAQRWRGEASD